MRSMSCPAISPSEFDPGRDREHTLAPRQTRTEWNPWSGKEWRWLEIGRAGWTRTEDGSLGVAVGRQRR